MNQTEIIKFVPILDNVFWNIIIFLTHNPPYYDEICIKIAWEMCQKDQLEHFEHIFYIKFLYDLLINIYNWHITPVVSSDINYDVWNLPQSLGCLGKTL